MPSRSLSRTGLATLTMLLAPALATGLRGQEGEEETKSLPLKEPVAYRVYQRDNRNLANIRIVPEEDSGAGRIAGAFVTDSQHNVLQDVVYDDGVLKGVPVGGPYSICVDDRDGKALANIEPVFVGDLWVLAGQSNMEGVGNLTNVTPPDNKVMLLGMDGQWSRAEEPLHWLVDSPDPVHSGNPDDREQRSKGFHRNRTKGAGLGLPFASEMVRLTNVPVGLIACAHGGTSMDQWSPAKKDEGGKSLYGSMMRQFKLAGGKIKGVLWYQGESDAGAAEAYPKKFEDFIAAVRKDFDQPDLPFYFVQIGRFINAGNPKGWKTVQDAQRKIPDRVPNTAVVSVIDLELDDGIHVGTQGLKRAGKRLANVAAHELFGYPRGTTPTFDRVSKGSDNTLVVKFKGVNPNSLNPDALGLQPATHIAGFSIRKADGTDIPLIFEAAVGPARDTVVLKLTGKIPEDAQLWYGYGFDPFCNLTDSLDMAVPVFGPIPLNDVR